jgi:hypothetical protein
VWKALTDALSTQPETRAPAMTDTFDESQASVLIDAAQQMIDVWNRLTPEKQALLLDRFGSQENALAALVTTQLVAPSKT